MMNDKNIDELFHDKLKDFEKTPPAYLFDNVMAGVSAARRRRKLMYWRIGTVAAALLLAFVAGWQISEYSSMGEKQTIVLHQDKTVQPQPQKSDIQLTETLSAENTRAKHTDNTTNTSKELNKSYLANQNKALENRNTLLQEALPVTETREKVEPLNTIEAGLESQELMANILQERKIEKTSQDQPVLSMDQQIMEQNLQAMQARGEDKKKNRWLVGAQVSPAVNVTRSSHSSQYASSMMNSSNSAVDLGGGLSVEYKPAKRWSVQSGVYYAGLAQTSGNITSSRADYANADIGMGYFNAPVNIVSDKMMMNSSAGVIEVKNIPSGMVVGTNLEDKSLSTAVVVSDAKFIQNFQYLEIPLYLRYTLVDARFDVQLLGGVSSNVLVGNNTYLDSNAGKSLIGKTQEMQNMSYSSTLGLGVKYGLSKRIYLNVEPRVKYYLHSLNNNPAVEYKPYTIGVFTGISYSF